MGRRAGGCADRETASASRSSNAAAGRVGLGRARVVGRPRVVDVRRAGALDSSGGARQHAAAGTEGGTRSSPRTEAERLGGPLDALGSRFSFAVVQENGSSSRKNAASARTIRS